MNLVLTAQDKITIQAVNTDFSVDFNGKPSEITAYTAQLVHFVLGEIARALNMNIELVREVFTLCLETAAELDKEKEFSADQSI